jgi:hypothetical protein
MAESLGDDDDVISDAEDDDVDDDEGEEEGNQPAAPRGKQVQAPIDDAMLHSLSSLSSDSSLMALEVSSVSMPRVFSPYRLLADRRALESSINRLFKQPDLHRAFRQ